MKKIVVFFGVAMIIAIGVYFFTNNKIEAKEKSSKVILLISEQNIEGPQTAWWVSEIDLSTVEATIANSLIASGYQVLEPSQINQFVKKDKAYKLVNVEAADSIELGKSTKADYIILGKAVASAGGTVPSSTMISCFANITAKLIKVSDGSVIAYLDASGKTVHMDKISGGREALAKAATDLSVKFINAIEKQGGN